MKNIGIFFFIVKMFVVQNLTHNMDISDFSMIIDEFGDGSSSAGSGEGSSTGSVGQSGKMAPNSCPTIAQKPVATSDEEDLKDANLERNLQFHIDSLTKEALPQPRRFTAEELIPQTMMRKAKKVNTPLKKRI